MENLDFIKAGESLLGENSHKPENNKNKDENMRKIYRSAMLVGAFVYILFAVFFFKIKNIPLAWFNFVFALLNILISINKKIPLAVFVLFEHIALITGAWCGVSVLGWDYGFQFLLPLGVGMSFFSPFKTKKIIGTISIIEIFLFVLFYYLYSSKPVVYVLPRQVIMLIHSFLFVFVNAMILYFSFRIDTQKNMYKKQIDVANEKLLYLAAKDDLTGLLNRRTIDEIIKKKWTKYKNEGVEFYLIMTDVDNFKSINDSNGHHAGDIVLKTTSDIFKSVFRKSDYVARWGGDEFLILLSEIPSKAVVEELLTRILNKISASNEKFSMSFGAASSSGKNDIEEIIKTADSCLYKAKKAGKNTFVIE